MDSTKTMWTVWPDWTVGTLMQMKPSIRKQPADSVPFGIDICTRGKHVWCAYSGETLVCVAATKKEALRKYQRARSGPLRPWVSHEVNEGRQDRPHPLEPGEPIGPESGGEYLKR